MKLNRNKLAVDALRQLFKDAYDNKYLQEIWNLVGAMRGPDDEDQAKKRNSTTPIRKVFLDFRMAQFLEVSDNASYLIKTEDTKPSVIIGSPIFNHFNYHVTMAQDVINGAFRKEDQNNEQV